MKYIVIIIEPSLPDEELTVESQINEAFGFDTYENADAWVTIFQAVTNGAPGKRFLIMPVSDPRVINSIA